METPKGWRKGQTVFNFLEWMLYHGYAQRNQNDRMADPFYIDDATWNKYYEEFLKEQRLKYEEVKI